MRVDLGGSKPRLTYRCGWRWIRMNTGDLHDVQGGRGSSPSRPTHNRRSEACSVVIFSTSALWEQRWEQPAESFRIVLK